MYRASQRQNNDEVTAMRSRRPQRDTGRARIERGSPPWIVGLSILVAALLLVVSVFLDWATSQSGLG
ncbi:hypothetical protein I553_6988 [Mycobacterium xenopi 4042]|uniref:Uncharacterized protein n=1 Tax=Mycobacterium xenopi 4042 TaxID=1299334 RepID=X7Z3F3_MYCXE|nr:hypothetical protein I553_6988 [Mycobacterium xenopi 4042]